MVRRAAILAMLLLAASPLPALAQSASASESDARPTPTALRMALAGTWKGALGYRDYQTNKLYELPVTTTIIAVPDGVTLIQRSIFDEGAGQQPVWITTTSIDDPKSMTVASASYRKGNKPELETEAIALERYAGQTDWTISYSQTGEDDDKPAQIRVTETRKGDALLSIKEVRPVNGDAPWTFRNQTKLTRTGD